MLKPELARLFFIEISKIRSLDALDSAGRARAFYDLLAKIFVAATEAEKFFFSTLFARISFAGHRFRIAPETLRLIHTFRRSFENWRKQGDFEAISEKTEALGLLAVAESIVVLSGSAMPSELLEALPRVEDLLFQVPETWDFKQKTRVIAVEDDAKNSALICWEEENPERTVRVLYDLPERNDNFQPTIEAVKKTFGFPISMFLHEVDIDRNGNYRPRAFVIEPDFLIDVSSVAECFKENGAETDHYLVKKFLPMDKTPAILLGNIANYFLDELMHDASKDYKDLIRKAFLLDPIVFSLLDDSTVKDIADKSQKHFLNLRKLVLEDFLNQEIEKKDCVLEPSFFSEQYGLQGRLDVFCQNDEKPAIIELKSGKAFMANSYGIGQTHFIQTLLYDLLIKSVFGKAFQPTNYIFYSGAETDALKFAPVVVAQQIEALQVRNQIVAIENELAQIMPAQLDVSIFRKIKGDGAKGFVKRDYDLFEKTYQNLDPTERKYFHSFVGFLAREHRLAKIGQHDSDRLNGHAALWLSGIDEKKEALEALTDLQIAENQAFADDPFIEFERTAATAELANFRLGDIAVLYPVRENGDSATETQVIKCTITELSRTRVRVQLRARQFNERLFSTAKHWNLEHDMMDNGFTAAYRGLFEWAGAEKRRRDLLLTRIGPSKNSNEKIINVEKNATPMIEWINDDEFFSKSGTASKNPKLTAEQSRIFQKLLASEDYFLLWGPPGTGKTSVMLREWVRHFFENSSENLLLLAYTNRAVDEICEAIESVSDEAGASYLRIGSRHATAENYRPKLLKSKIEKARKRSEILEILAAHRIVVGTTASFSGSYEIFSLKNFDRVVVDEASQILEPGLVGLLSRFKHFTLIGDHRQLPAVSAQGEKTSRIEDAELEKWGLRDLRESLFERLFRRCEAEKWTWAFDKLSHQGRMHEAIMAFPNAHFYGGFLKTLPDSAKQNAAASSIFSLAKKGVEPSDFLKKTFEKRVAFVHVQPDADGLAGKTSRGEAEHISLIIKDLQNFYFENGLEWRPSAVGVIAPFRAQIALIRKTMQALEIDPDSLTIDTVERYQGGARDVILISLCASSRGQLDALVSLNDEGVDRKLNVALTRAREHVVLFGNAAILKNDARYAELISEYEINVND